MREFLAFVVLLGLVHGCTSWEYPQSFPVVFTEKIGKVSPEGAVFNGRIETLGTGAVVVSHGFVWSEAELPTLSSFHRSHNEDAGLGMYSLQVTSDLMPGAAYHVRSFVQTDKMVVYGNDVVFTAQGSSPPVFEDFNPKEGAPGTEVTIKGHNFSSRLQNNIVKLGDYECELLAGTDTTLIVKIPLESPVGHARFLVTGLNVGIVISENEFETTGIAGTKILSLSKLSGRVGDFVLAQGEGFETTGIVSPIIWFGGAPSLPTILSSNQLEFPIPDFVGVSRIDLNLFVGDVGQSFEYPEDFTSINSWNTISPSSPLDNFYGYASARVDNSIFVMGGKTLYEYNTSAHTWTTKTDFPGSYRFFGSAFSYDSKVYYGFGDGFYEANHAENHEHYSDLWSYDPATDQWQLVSTSLYFGFEALVSFVINDKAFFCCGWQVGSQTDTPRKSWTFDLMSQEWNPSTTPPNVPLYNNSAVGFAIGGKGYTVGFGNYEDGHGLEEVWEFDPANASWTRKADYPGLVYETGATTKNGHGLVLSWRAGNPSRVFEFYPERNQWITRQSISGRTTPMQFFQYVNSKLHYGSGPVWEMSFE